MGQNRETCSDLFHRTTSCRSAGLTALNQAILSLTRYLWWARHHFIYVQGRFVSKPDNTRPYHHGNLATVIRQSAWDIVGEMGVRGLSLRECARRANVSHSAPAHHFGSLDNLLSEIAADGYERMFSIISVVQSELDDPMLGCGIGYVKFATTYPHHFRLMFGRDGTTRTLPRLLKSSEATLEQLRQSLRIAWITRNATEPDAIWLEQRTFLAWSTAHGYASLAIDRKPNQISVTSPEEIFKLLTSVLLAP